MLSSFAQLVTPVLHGNAIIQGHDIQINETANSLFKHRKAKFYEVIKAPGGASQQLLNADNANGWFSLLKTEKVYALQLLNKMIYGNKPTSCISTEADRPTFDDTSLSVLFIETQHPYGSDLWQAWDLGLPHTSYLRIATNQPNRILKLRPVTTVKQELGNILEKLMNFIQVKKKSEDYDYDLNTFELALSVLSSKTPRAQLEYFYDLSPPNFLSPEAEQLLAAVVVLEQLSTYYQSYSLDKKYIKLTDELLRLRFESISLVVNSSARLLNNKM